MPNDFYTRAYSPLPEQRVSSQVLKDEFARVEAGFDEVQGDADRAIKLPVGTADQTLAMNAVARANLVLAFDAAGNITAISYGRFRGDWLTETAYVVSDYFRDPVSKNIYAVIAGHTSGVLATDIAASKVQLAINVEDVEAAKTAAEAAALTATSQAALAATSASDAAASELAAQAAQAAAESVVATIPEGTISDATTSLTSVWSSSKVAEAIAGIPTGSSLLRSARTSNTVLGAADKGTLIDITSGTFSQTFDAAATLGDGWWCYLRNSGSGVVTLDPNSTELIDGAATKNVYANAAVIVQCDGTVLRTLQIGDFGGGCVVVHTGNGYGSSSNRIRRFTTTLLNSGTAITYADSATLGGSFTINEPGLYAIEYTDHAPSAPVIFGISLNAGGTDTISSGVPIGQRLALVSAAYSTVQVYANASAIARLSQNDVVRAHVDTASNPTSSSAFAKFTIAKVGP